MNNAYKRKCPFIAKTAWKFQKFQYLQSSLGTFNIYQLSALKLSSWANSTGVQVVCKSFIFTCFTQYASRLKV